MRMLTFRVGPIAYPVGTASFLGSFFDTIEVRLESGQRGRDFPALAALYSSGELASEDAVRARNELADVAVGLQALPVADLVWDAKHPEQTPPWGDRIAATIRTLRDYHVTADGRSLIGVLDEALATSVAIQRPLRLQ
ncbi:Imm70 family immunity protein [Microbacterium sp. ZW T5_56]|uniref:Imm70 family immunity protein n=1 Tax=Microbacterium sp. ZW T5_56 TaxID=3378081 RepID=UPI0038537A06